MLKSFELSKTDHRHHQEFKRSLQENPSQIYQREAISINALLKGQAMLSIEEAWQGEKFKGKEPHLFTDSIVVSTLIPGTEKITEYGETYLRLSIQPDWMTKKLVVVKEEVHADDVQKKMLFFGREIDATEAKLYLLPALLAQIYGNDSSKRTAFMGKNFNLMEAKEYFSQHFDDEFLSTTPALFHVEHGIEARDNQPFDTWNLVRLCEASTFEKDMNESNQLRDLIAKSLPTKTFVETVNRLQQIKDSKSYLKK